MEVTWKLAALGRNSHPWLTRVGGPIPQLPRSNSDMFTPSLESPSQTGLWLPALVMALIIHLMFPSPFHFPTLLAGLSWVHPHINHLSWGLLLEEPKFRQVCFQDCDAGPQGMSIFMILCNGLDAYLNEVNYLSVVHVANPTWRLRLPDQILGNVFTQLSCVPLTFLMVSVLWHNWVWIFSWGVSLSKW